VSAVPRVLVVHGSISPYRVPLFSELAKTVQLDVIFCEGVAADRQWASDLTGVDFGYKFLRSRRYGLVVLNLGLLKTLRALRPTVYVLADNQENLLTLTLVALHARVRRKPVIVWSEQVPKTALARSIFAARYRPLVFWGLERVVAAYRRWLYRCANSFASMSGEASDRYLTEAGVSRDRIFTGTQVMPDNLMPMPGPLSSALTWPEPFVLFLGYFRPEKGASRLIDAFREAETGGFSLIVAGSGPEGDALRERARGLQLVHFVGHVDGEAKASLLATAAAVVVPSDYEPWGLVVNESLFYGTPVICSSVVAASQLLSPASGMIFEDFTGLVDCLTRFCGDESLRVTLRQGAKDVPQAKLADPRVGVRHLLAAISSATQGVARTERARRA
jgi:Glycosyl transferases group 1